MNLSRAQRIKYAFGSVCAHLIGQSQTSANMFRAAFTGQWEGGRVSRMRDTPPRRIASQDTDLNYGVREDLLSSVRSLEQRYPIVKRIKRQYATYSVGRCQIKWNTGDPKVDAEYSAAWDDWMLVCDYKARHSFPKLMKLAVSQGFSDGDMFVQKIGTGQSPLIDLIESDRVSSAGIYNADLYGTKGPSMIGGIGLDETTGRAKFIRVWQRTIYGTFVNPVEVPVSDYLHYFETNRVDAARGVTGYHCIINSMIDLKEIDDAQRAKTKLGSKLAILAKLMTGPVQPAVDFFGGSSVQTADGGSGGAVQVQSVGDGAMIYSFPNESYEAINDASPPENWEKHMEFIVRMIALGVDLPFGIVWNMAGLGKPGVLVELNQAARTISDVQEELERRLIRPICGWWLSWMIAKGRLPFTPSWYRYSIARPAYISIDAGRDSTAAINENKLGMKSMKAWYEEDERDWQEEINQCIAERKYLEERCKAEKIDPNNVRMMNNNPGGGMQQSDTPVTGKEIGD